MIAKLYYNGWLQLPASALRTLGIQTGSSLEIVLDTRGLLLRPTGSTPAADTEQPRIAAAAQPTPRKPGRPRKVATEPTATSLVLPAPTRRIGGRRKTAPASPSR